MATCNEAPAISVVHISPHAPDIPENTVERLQPQVRPHVKKSNCKNCWSFLGLTSIRKGKLESTEQITKYPKDRSKDVPEEYHGNLNSVVSFKCKNEKSWFRVNRKRNSVKKQKLCQNYAYSDLPSKTSNIAIETDGITAVNDQNTPAFRTFGKAEQASFDQTDVSSPEDDSGIFSKSVQGPVYEKSFIVKRSNGPRAKLGVTFQDDNYHRPSKIKDSNSQLAAAIDYCDRRLERLYGRLIWLRNSGDLSLNFPDKQPCDSPSIRRCTTDQAQSGDSASQQTSEVKNGSSNGESLIPIERKIKCISDRLRQLRSQLESYAYLSWLGLTEEPQPAKLAVPGRGCPTPNPQLHLIRRSDLACQATMQEFQRLCQTPIPEGTRISLRETTFDNWPWSDAWLIRFVRQMFFDLELVDHFKLSVVRLDTWLCDVYRRYNRVPFHNYKHAFMVTQMAYAIIWSANLNVYLMKEEQLILLISAICHDLDHPGFNNAYQINAGTELAVRYNDQSPLENHHSAMAFDILSRAEANVLSHLDIETCRRVREGIIRCILATDMSRHNDILRQFNEVLLGDLEACQAIDGTTKRPMWSVDKVKLDLVMMILIKVCDISNEARPLAVSDPWINRLLAEFFNQSDYEKLLGLPVAPFMDRANVTKAASQCGFIRFVILPLYTAAARLIQELEDVIVKPVMFQLDYYMEMQKTEESNDPICEDPEVEPEQVESTEDNPES